MLHYIIFSHFLYNHEKKIFPSNLKNMEISDIVAGYPVQSQSIIHHNQLPNYSYLKVSTGLDAAALKV